MKDRFSDTSRRGFIKKITVGSAGLGVAGFSPAGWAAPPPPTPEEADFTFIHLTDMHVRRKRKGHLGYARCVDHVNSLRPRPDFVLMGGDGPFDGLYTEKEEFADQIELFRSISEKLEMPYFHCIGNHDALGYSERRKVPVDDPDIGKTFIMDRLGMERSTYSFDRHGWHFVVLDSIFPVEAEHGPAYEPRIGSEQMEWLRFDLGAHSGQPTVVVVHIPVFSNVAQVNGDTDAPAIHARVLQDGAELRHILERHRVKAVLQGHLHISEDFRFNDVWYVGSQSVSAAWWGGNWRGFKPGYTVFAAKGESLGWRRQEFDWEHHLEPEDDLERERIREQERFRREQRRLLEEERASASEPA